MKRLKALPELLEEFDSVGVSIAPVAEGRAPYRLTCATYEPGGTIGPHPTSVPQVFCVVSGGGWVSGADGIRHPITDGEAVFWEAGEMHASGSAGGMTALILQSPDPSVLMGES